MADPTPSMSAVDALITELNTISPRSVDDGATELYLYAKRMIRLGAEPARVFEVMNTTVTAWGEDFRQGIPAAEINRLILKAGEPPVVDDSIATWQEPQALPTGLPPVPTMASALLPERFRAFVLDESERMQAPPDFLAIALMVVVGAIIGDRVGIRPKQHDDWVVVPNLWGAVVGPPSSKKSPCLSKALAFIHELEQQAKDEHAVALAVHQRSLAKHEIQANARRSEATRRAKAHLRSGADARDDGLDALLDDGGPIAAEPVRRRYLTNDATVEKLGELLRDNPHGILVFRDELSGWMRAMDRDGHEQDRGFHLESFNGTGRFTYDRIGRGTVEIEHAIQSVLGGIQPGPLRLFLAEAAQGKGGDDGLVPRFQLLTWPDPPSDFRLVDRQPDQAARQLVKAVITRLDQLDPNAVGATTAGGSSLAALRFDTSAQARWNDWYELVNIRQRGGEMPPMMQAYLGKLEKTVASLALLFHLIDGGTGPVTEAGITRALAWAEYLELHACRAYHACLNSELVTAVALGDKLRAGLVPDGFGAREIYRHGWTGLADPRAVESAITVLEDLDWVRGEPPLHGSGRPKRPRYRINPRIPGLIPTKGAA